MWVIWVTYDALAYSARSWWITLLLRPTSYTSRDGTTASDFGTDVCVTKYAAAMSAACLPLFAAFPMVGTRSSRCKCAPAKKMFWSDVLTWNCGPRGVSMKSGVAKDHRRPVLAWYGPNSASGEIGASPLMYSSP